MNIIAQNIINKAFLLSGITAINETPGGPEAHDALNTLNMILGVYQLEQLLNFSDLVINATLTPGLNPHTIGGPSTGATFEANRPFVILNAFVRDNNNNDFYLTEIDALQYDSISGKSISAEIPSLFYYNPKFPNGELFLSPVPSTAYTINIRYKNPLGMFGTLTTAHNYPDGYEMLLTYNLAYNLAAEYGSPKPELLQMVESIKNTIKKNNWQNYDLSLDSRTPFGDNSMDGVNFHTGLSGW